MPGAAALRLESDVARADGDHRGAARIAIGDDGVEFAGEFRRRAQEQPSLPLVRYVPGWMSLPTRQIPSSKLLAGSCGFGLGLVVGGVVVTGVAAANTPEYCGHR
jgi:hypothetical protein